jgi:hypothetical protein
MRRGAEAEEYKMGGAWHRVARPRTGKSRPGLSLDASATANTMAEADKPCPDESCTKGPCMVGMSLQQSWP